MVHIFPRSAAGFSAVLALLLTTPGPAASPGYAVIDLGTLGGAPAGASAVNESTQVAGSSGSGFFSRAFIYDHGIMTDIGLLPGGGYAHATDLNDFGEVVGFSQFASGGGYSEHAFRYLSGVLSDIGALPGYPWSRASGINNLGHIVGYCTDGPPYGGSTAFVYASGSMTALPFFPEGRSSEATDINDHGQIVGGAAVPVGGGFQAFHAFLFDGGTMVDLGTLPGGNASRAEAISKNGIIVGASFVDLFSSYWHAFIHRDGAMTDLGTLSGYQSFALDVNDSAQVVGYFVFDRAGQPIRHAFLHSNGETRDLNELIPQDSGWELQQALGINKSGAIVGHGIVGGETHAYLLEVDRDGDGLPDSWESRGVPIQGVAERYNLPGADPMQKDLYVEVDATDPSLAPSIPSLQMVVDAFARPPLSTRLHIPGANSSCDPCVDEDNIGGGTWGEPTQLPSGDWVPPSGFYALRAAHFGSPSEQGNAPMLKAKSMAYRYCIFGESYTNQGKRGSSGIAELPGNDFAVTLGFGWFPSTDDEKAGTFMHELGHTLGLKHGGDKDERDGPYNFKPNLYSVMNYLWQTRPKTNVGDAVERAMRQRWADGWDLRYSNEAFANLDETALNEQVGVGGPTQYRTLVVPVGRPPGAPLPVAGPLWRLAPLSGGYDWDGDGTIGLIAAFPVDVNYVPGLPGSSPLLQQDLNGFEQSSMLQYLPRAHPNWSYGAPAPSPAQPLLATTTSPPFNGEFTAEMRDAMNSFRFDCNNNGHPDGEDITNGVLHDSNGNNLPDECEAVLLVAVPSASPARTGLSIRPLATPTTLETARFEISLPSPGDVEVDAFDISGRRVNSVFRGALSAGLHLVPWKSAGNAAALPAGLYFVRLTWQGSTVTSRVVLTR